MEEETLIRCRVKDDKMKSRHPELEPYCLAVYASMTERERKIDMIRAALHLRVHRREIESK